MVAITRGCNGGVLDKTPSSDEVKHAPGGVARPLFLSREGFALLRRGMGVFGKFEGRGVGELEFLQLCQGSVCKLDLLFREIVALHSLARFANIALISSCKDSLVIVQARTGGYPSLIFAS